MAVPPDRLQDVWVLSWRRIRFVSHLLRSQEGNDEAKKKRSGQRKQQSFAAAGDNCCRGAARRNKMS